MRHRLLSLRPIATTSPQRAAEQSRKPCCVATSPLRRARITSAALSRLALSFRNRQAHNRYARIKHIDSQIVASRIDRRDRELATVVGNR